MNKCEYSGSLLHTIGNTPVVQLHRIVKDSGCILLAKLEGQNPGGSVKDRVARYMIEQAEKRGELYPGKTIIEATSGNMGIAVAMVGAQKGYPVRIVMSEGMSTERKIMLATLGAELILTDKSFGTEGAIRKVREMVENEPGKYWFVNQFNNPDNIEAHYHGLAVELLRDVPTPDVVVAGIGTSGTVLGLTKRLKEQSPTTHIVGVIPPKGYQIQGMQNPNEDFSGDICCLDVVDELFHVTVDDAYAMARTVARTEGLFVGMSSGAILCAAVSSAECRTSGTVVAILPDRGEKYLSTRLFDDVVQQLELQEAE